MERLLDAGWRLTIEPGGQHCTVAPGQTLLAALDAAGIAWPASCRNGTCRSCLAHCTGGAPQHRIPWPGLSADEKKQGYVLPCVCEARSDLVLRAPVG